MAKRENSDAMRTEVCINEVLTDDELRAIMTKLENDKDKENLGFVCKRWLYLQSTERRKLCARAGPLMLQKLAARFTRLVELDLSQSSSRSFFPGVTDSDLAVIAAGFGCLQVLSLQNCKGVTDAGMVALGNGLTCLQSLDVSHCRKLTDKGLAAIAKGCVSLRSLHLVGCRCITDGLLTSLSKNCHNLEALVLEGCTKITDSGLTALVDGCRHIKVLDVNKCSNIGDIGIISVSKACSSLRALKLLDCYKVGDDSIFSLAHCCKNLETLVIGGCRNISNESIKSLASACHRSLKNLRMDWCLKISDSSLSCVLSKCKNLEALDIGCCEEVSDTAFQALGGGGHDSALKILKVSNCQKITVLGIGMLLESCKMLKYLDVRCCPHVTKLGCEQAGLRFPEYCKVNFTGSLSEPDVLIGMRSLWFSNI
ncbi:F-box/LRR-repeat protein 4-like [Macadamia integrifolia]|uniref:F-box/LRR-repeat protein 4-like n=1 Tax=Macadamia integrifolia TaxID=60698 RepID=UPI001C4F2807|nr:F-box/LRR-repeat protein 4-like [Macadamia integrifolia]